VATVRVVPPPPRAVAAAVRALGSRVAVADLLRVPRAEIDAWLAGAGSPTPPQLRVLEDLRAVVARLGRVREVPSGWLRSPCAALDGATPEDVLVVEGAGRVLAAIDDELGPG
jgi:hypothetical protein